MDLKITRAVKGGRYENGSQVGAAGVALHGVGLPVTLENRIVLEAATSGFGEEYPNTLNKVNEERALLSAIPSLKHVERSFYRVGALNKLLVFF